jgi:hypothetical protein
MINDEGHRNAEYPDLIITHCKHVFKYHTVFYIVLMKNKNNKEDIF